MMALAYRIHGHADKPRSVALRRESKSTPKKTIGVLSGWVKYILIKQYTTSIYPITLILFKLLPSHMRYAALALRAACLYAYCFATLWIFPRRWSAHFGVWVASTNPLLRNNISYPELRRSLTEMSELPPRLLAKTRNHPTFLHHCDFHGHNPHWTRGGLCVDCFDSRGYARSERGTPLSSARIDARQNGAKSFLHECDKHGRDTPHSTATGKCLTCFTTSGMRRERAPPDMNPRAMARQAGRVSFLFWCDKHGAIEHSVRHGKCLGCFTAQGTKRKIMRIE